MSKKRYKVDLMRQMAECDANYIRLLKLLPQLRTRRGLKGLIREFHIASTQTSAASATEAATSAQAVPMQASTQTIDALCVRLRIVETFKYTSTLLITQQPRFMPWMPGPAMLVRLYHDANSAEVISYQGHRGFKSCYPQPNPFMYQPDEKLQVNLFLGEWLSHCLKAGRSLAVPELL